MRIICLQQVLTRMHMCLRAGNSGILFLIMHYLWFIYTHFLFNHLDNLLGFFIIVFLITFIYKFCSLIMTEM